MIHKDNDRHSDQYLIKMAKQIQDFHHILNLPLQLLKYGPWWALWLCYHRTPDCHQDEKGQRV